jgi:ketosteroid isomerase-like protein
MRSSEQQMTADLIELERRRGEALIGRDAATLEALMAADLVHIHSTGTVMNKAQLMDYVMTVLQFLELERSELKVQVYGNVAVMTGRMRARMQRADKPEPVSAESWVTQVWVRQAHGWVQSHFHSVRAASG